METKDFIKKKSFTVTIHTITSCDIFVYFPFYSALFFLMLITTHSFYSTAHQRLRFLRALLVTVSGVSSLCAVSWNTEREGCVQMVRGQSWPHRRQHEDLWGRGLFTSGLSLRKTPWNQSNLSLLKREKNWIQMLKKTLYNLYVQRLKQQLVHSLKSTAETPVWWNSLDLGVWPGASPWLVVLLALPCAGHGGCILTSKVGEVTPAWFLSQRALWKLFRKIGGVVPVRTLSPSQNICTASIFTCWVPQPCGAFSHDIY